MSEPRIYGEYCQIDGTWKATERCAGLGWFYNNRETGEQFIGSSNLRRGLTPLQMEVEALVWAMQCLFQYNKHVMVFETDCSDVVKMVSNLAEWPAFSILLEEVDRCRRRFITYDIHHIPMTKSTKADKGWDGKKRKDRDGTGQDTKKWNEIG
ncbi:unnamed protein product [Microthlaspi erraticum]|uniref:RNase H type-1 domain-containing protein n=1 Tax=Microthlaspi erraticum TaxID=1685480 RepID=A0A6D2HNH5_9BRAS|nr:unnamed protein product [Microthlaspi erraticum]